MSLVTSTDKHEILTKEIDIVAKDFMEHKWNLLTKIATILMNAIENSFKEAHKIEWNKKKQSADPNAYIL